MELSYTVKENVIRKQNERIRALEEKLGRGKAKSYEEYKEQAGIIQGLRDSLDTFNRTLSDIMSEEDLDD